MLRTYTFPVDVWCGACTPHVESLIRGTKLKIIGDIRTNIVSKITSVDVEVDPLADDNTNDIIRAALDDGGRLREDPDAACPAVTQTPATNPISTLDSEPTAVVAPTTNPPKSKPRWLSWLLGGIGVVNGLVIMAIMLSGIALPFMVMAALGIASAVISLALGATTIYSAAKNLKHGSLNMDTLYALGGITAIITTIAHLFLPGFPMIFDAALLIFGFKHIGDAVKERATRPAERDMSFRERAKVMVLVESLAKEVELNNIPIGTIIRVARDSIIPIDGVILDDEACLYETLLNGEDKVKVLSKNKSVLSGFRVANDNPNPYIRIQTTHSAEDSNLSQLDKRLSLEKQHKPQITITTESILLWFIPIVITIAIISAVIVGTCFFPAVGAAGAFALGIKCLIGVIVSACPCTIGLATPLAESAGMSKAETKQVYFKKDEAIQAAAQIKVILVDLNGTLTMGKPIVKSFYAKCNPQKILSTAMTLESHSRHSFAKAITQYAAAKIESPNITTVENAITTRTGVSGLINGELTTIGNTTMLQQKNLDAEKYLRENNIIVSGIQQLVYITNSKEILGHFVLEDPIRHGAKETVTQLQALGYEVVLCTGAEDNIAKAYAREFNITRVFANCKNIANKSDDPNLVTKFSVVKSEQAKGNEVAMIGDAGNDAIAIAASHFGIAIKSASSDAITQNVADAVIDGESLLPVVALFEIARQTVSNIKQNVVTSLSLNSLSIAAAITGTALTALGFVFPPAIGAGLMVLLLLPVLANVARLKNQELPYYEKAKEQVVISETLYSTASLRKEMISTSESDHRPAPLADARGSVYRDLLNNDFTNDTQRGISYQDLNKNVRNDVTRGVYQDLSESDNEIMLLDADDKDEVTHDSQPSELSRARQQAVLDATHTLLRK